MFATVRSRVIVVLRMVEKGIVRVRIVILLVAIRRTIIVSTRVRRVDDVGWMNRVVWKLATHGHDDRYGIVEDGLVERRWCSTASNGWQGRMRVSFDGRAARCSTLVIGRTEILVGTTMASTSPRNRMRGRSISLDFSGVAVFTIAAWPRLDRRPCLRLLSFVGCCSHGTGFVAFANERHGLQHFSFRWLRKRSAGIHWEMRRLGNGKALKSETALLILVKYEISSEELPLVN